MGGGGPCRRSPSPQHKAASNAVITCHAAVHTEVAEHPPAAGTCSLVAVGACPRALQEAACCREEEAALLALASHLQQQQVAAPPTVGLLFLWVARDPPPPRARHPQRVARRPGPPPRLPPAPAAPAEVPAVGQPRSAARWPPASLPLLGPQTRSAIGNCECRDPLPRLNTIPEVSR